MKTKTIEYPQNKLHNLELQKNKATGLEKKDIERSIERVKLQLKQKLDEKSTS